MTKQVLVSFSIGKYKDEVLCDVVHMHDGHILLGRPWKFDIKVNMMVTKIDMFLFGTIAPLC